jgi:hypothetical protein
MPDFGIMRGFNEKLFGDKLVAGQLPTQLGLIGSIEFGFDSDAVAFFNRVTAAGGSLSPTEQLAVDTLVKQMKLDGIWSAMKAIYPMVGASAAACAQNLKSSSFTGTFTSGWTFASTGVKGNGLTAYMETSYNPSVSGLLNSGHVSVYSRNDIQVGSTIDFGSNAPAHFICYYFGTQTYSGMNSSDNPPGPAFTPTTSLLLISRISSSTAKIFRAGTLVNTDGKPSTSIPNQTLTLSALNNGGSKVLFASREYAFASIGDGLTDTQAGNFYTAVQAFQTTLSRQV